MAGTASPASKAVRSYNPRAVLSRLWHFTSQPEQILGILLAIMLGALVLVPLFELIRETLTVQPYDRAYLPKAQPGEFTLFHYERVSSPGVSPGRSSTSRSSTRWSRPSPPRSSVLSFGAGFAWLIVRTNIPFRNFLHTLVMIPYMLPSWVIALAWITFFKNDRIGGASGAFAYFFGAQPPDWIAYGPIPIIICLSLHYYVYSYLSVSSSMTSVDSQLEEAGRDGRPLTAQAVPVDHRSAASARHRLRGGDDVHPRRRIVRHAGGAGHARSLLRAADTDLCGDGHAQCGRRLSAGVGARRPCLPVHLHQPASHRRPQELRDAVRQGFPQQGNRPWDPGAGRFSSSSCCS